MPGIWSIGWSLELWAFVVFGKDHRTGELSSSLAPTGEAFFGDRRSTDAWTNSSAAEPQEMRRPYHDHAPSRDAAVTYCSCEPR